MTEGDFAATLTDCTLDGAVIRGNTFIGVTFAGLMVADSQALRLQDNNVGGGVAGFWFSLSHITGPTGVAQGMDRYYNTVLNFEEFQFLIGLAPLLPPPLAEMVLRRAEIGAASGAADSVATTDLATAFARTGGRGINASIFVTGNHVVTGQHPTAGNTPTGISALLLWLNSDANADVLQNSDITAVVANNHFLTASRDVPAALMVLADSQPAAVSGNVVLNQPGPIGNDRDAPSLWVVISNTLKVTQPFAATGNVLRGLSDLSMLSRDGATSRAGWSVYNADPF